MSKKTDVPLLTALAAFHISLGLGLHPDATSGQSTEKLFDEATMLLNEAERHDQTNIALLLRKGLLLLAQRKLGLAEYQLKMVTSKEPDSIAAHVALVSHSSYPPVPLMMWGCAGSGCIPCWRMEDVAWRVPDGVAPAAQLSRDGADGHWTLHAAAGQGERGGGGV